MRHVMGHMALGVNAGAGPWSPVMAGSLLHMWYDADDRATVDETSGRVTEWRDKSGNGYHMKASADDRPWLADWSGQQAIDFQAGNVMRSTTGPGANNQGPMSCFAAIHNVAAGKTRPIFWFGGGTGAWSMRIGTGDRAELYRGTGMATGPVATVSGYASVSGHGDKADAGQHYVGLDGVYGAAATSSHLGALTVWCVGANDAQSVHFEGSIGELMIFESNDSALLEQAETYISTKWGTP